MACSLVQANVQANASAPDWPAHNRFVALQGVSMGLHYHERDASGQTPDGVFNRERGHIPGGGLALRWQGSQPWVFSASPFVSVSGQRVRGQTAYQGYLQYTSGALEPFQARTGNTLRAVDARLGLAWPVHARGQVVPYVGLSAQR